MSATNAYKISVSTGNDNVNVAVRNYSSSQAKVQVCVRMIYVKNEIC